MKDLRHVRKRIAKRRGSYSMIDTGTRTPWLFRWLYRFVMTAMGVCLLVLALLVGDKLKWFSLSDIAVSLQLEKLAAWLPFEDWFSLQDEAVASTPVYTPLTDNQYSNGTNMAYNAYHGVVLHVQTEKNGKQSVVMKQDNGVVATYGNLDAVEVKQDERILKGKVLGTYTSYVTIDFLKDQQTISYAEALA